MKPDDHSPPAAIQDVVTDQSKWYCDTFTGRGPALVSAGRVTIQQLEEQAGSKFGRAAFLPDGSPIPSGSGGRWRMPGYKVVVALGQDQFRVEISVEKEEQSRRSAAIAAARCAKREHEILAELKTRKAELLTAPLTHGWDDWCESWEGTKAQLQAEGIGIGKSFPGELGMPSKVVTFTHPEGFAVEVHPHYDRVKQLAGQFHAWARYAEPAWMIREKEVRDFAPGVQLVIDMDATDSFVGTADALVACGLARLDQFPGQPGRGKVQCSYRADGSRSTSNFDRRKEDFLQISRKGKNRFEIQRPASESERKRREIESDKREADVKKEAARIRSERMKARGGAAASQLKVPGATAEVRYRVAEDLLEGMPSDEEEFRLKTIQTMRTHFMHGIEVARSAINLHGYSIDTDPISMSFDAITDAVLNADVQFDAVKHRTTQTHLRAVMAANDPAFRNSLAQLLTPSLDDGRKS